MKEYDLLVVGSGLFGATCACEAVSRDKKVLVLEKRNHVGGNVYTKKIEGIDIHRYGAHIFHTSDKYVWDYVNKFAKFIPFINSPLAYYKGELFNLPFNMNTFSKMFSVTTADEARAVIEKQRSEIKGEPKNLEEQAVSLVGRDIYTKLIKGYTEKQWGKDCKDLPAFIIKRLPVRFTYDNNYFDDKYQGIPAEGYTEMIEKMLEGATVKTGVDFLKDKEGYLSLADRCIYTGAIDAYFDYALGKLEYRSLRFEDEILDEEVHQSVAVVNYTEREVPYTRIIEHKHFNPVKTDKTVITKEYPLSSGENAEPYYPVNDQKNNELYNLYAKRAKPENVLFGGRLAEYRYLDMDDTVAAALSLCQTLFG